MWRVNPPEVEVSEVANNCASKLRDRELAERVRSTIPYLEKNHADFIAATKARCTHEIDPSSYSVSDLSNEEMLWLYNRQVSRANGGARKQYELILANALFGLCSYCQYGQATTLDHFVPKSWLPGLAIDPWNLIPSCQQCNRKLGDTWAKSEHSQLFHPYCEDVTSRWLYAEVLEDEPVAVLFSARPDPRLDEKIRKRVINQFNELGLALMYGAVSGKDIAEARSVLTGNHIILEKDRTDDRAEQQFDAETVSKILSETAGKLFHVDPNSRRGAVYEALSENVWFCSEGYLP